MNWSRFRPRGIALLAAAAVTVAAIWGFAEIADEVLEGETLSFDEKVVRWMRRPEAPSVLKGPQWLHEVGRDVTALGSYAVLTLVTLAVGSFLFLQRRYRTAVLVVAAAAGGGLISTILKSIFDRGRPDLPAIVYVTSSSFPSGHAMLSAVVYLTLGVLVAELVEKRRLKLHCLLTAMLISFLVGVSRVYLGVHYPTDVLAGWLAGIVWAMLCWMGFQYLGMRK
ncbi:MAG TPA: phosphatase PAP2 family protein [Desulfobacterales bacterium]